MKTKKLIRFDWALKYILRNKANFDVLEGFLSNLLKEDITVDSLVESEGNRPEETQKFNKVDLQCRDASGRYIIIEIQNQREVDYLQRILWGTSKTVVESLNLGCRYSEVVKVISISIMYHPFRRDEQSNTDFLYYGVVEMAGMHSGKPLILHGKKIKGEEITTITSAKVFPEYYMIYVEKFDDIVKESIDEWIYFFKHGEIREDFTSPGILLAAKKLDYLAMQTDEKRAYDDYLAYLGRELGIIDSAKEDGRVEGRVEGEQIGFEKGKVEGIVEGERVALERTARNLRTKGFRVEDIASATGMSIEEIKRL